jgi:hypothetical protein
MSLLAAVRAAGGTIRRDGDLIRLAAPAPLPVDLVERIRAAKAAVLIALDESSDWHARHQEALAYWVVLHPIDEAERLAWGELENRWHRLHGERVPRHLCAGCRRPLGDAAALDLADGCRVHLDAFHCLLDYGDRWRDAATRALRAMGLQPAAKA